MTEEQKERLQQLLENDEILNHVNQLKYDIETIENKIHDFWRRVSENISIEFEAGKPAKIDFREGSIMIDLFNQERGKFNCYLEYTVNFNEIPFLGIWLNKSYSEKFKALGPDNEGYIMKKPLSHFLSKEVFSEYVLRGNDSAFQSIYTNLNTEITTLRKDAQNSIQKLKTASPDLIL